MRGDVDNIGIGTFFSSRPAQRLATTGAGPDSAESRLRIKTLTIDLSHQGLAAASHPEPASNSATSAPGPPSLRSEAAYVGGSQTLARITLDAQAVAALRRDGEEVGQKGTPIVVRVV